MAEAVSMVVVDGVRYRPEDAPSSSGAGAKQGDAKNKARSAANKATDTAQK